VPRITRTAEVVWEGNVARGNGSISAGSSAFEALPFSLPTRIGNPDGKTSPEELLAAAHAGCFAMSIASELVGAGVTPGRIDVRCEILMDEVEGEGHQILGSSLRVRVAADGMDDAVLAAAVDRADAGCAFTTLLKKAGARIEIDHAPASP
jgi:osmotically inducible protein OsmC